MLASISKNLLIIAVMQLAFFAIFASLPNTVSAAKASDAACKKDPKSQECKDSKNKDQQGIDCSKVDCSDPAADANAKCDRDGCDLVKAYINPFIKVLSGLIGLIAAISLIMGGIQYSAAAGDPQKITAAKDRISKTIIALVMYMFLFAFLQFLIPGGAFR